MLVSNILLWSDHLKYSVLGLWFLQINLTAVDVLYCSKVWRLSSWHLLRLSIAA